MKSSLRSLQQKNSRKSLFHAWSQGRGSKSGLACRGAVLPERTMHSHVCQPGAWDVGVNLAPWVCFVPPPAQGPWHQWPLSHWGFPLCPQNWCLGLCLIILGSLAEREDQPGLMKGWKMGEESHTKSGTSSPNTGGWLQALAASHVPRVYGILVLYLPELITNPGQACQIIDLIHQLLLLFPSKNSSFRSLTPSMSGHPGDSDAHKLVTILHGHTLFPH